MEIKARLQYSCDGRTFKKLWSFYFPPFFCQVLCRVKVFLRSRLSSMFITHINFLVLFFGLKVDAYIYYTFLRKETNSPIYAHLLIS